MTDVHPMPTTPVPPPVPASALTSDENRLMALIVYGLYLAALLSVGVAGIAGVIVAYVKRGDARGTIWESHYDNQITIFWGWIGLCIIGGLTFWVFGLGLVVIALAFVWFLYRTIKGLVHAIELRPFA